MEKDTRTGAIRLNPPQTLEVIQGDRPPPNSAFSVEYNGRYYAVPESGTEGPEDGTQWNLRAFGMLYQLYQMTFEQANVPVPGIAIAK